MPLQDRKQRLFDHREQEILAAALELCSTPDWERVTISEIAAQAEIGKGTVYKHFASKDALLFRLSMDFYRGLLALLRSAPSSGTPLQQLGDAVEHALRYHLEQQAYRYVVSYCDRIDFKERADPSWHAAFLELDRAFVDWAEPMLTAGMDQGQIERRGQDALLIGISAAFRGAVAMLWASEHWCPLGDKERIIQSTRDFIVAALAGPCDQGHEQEAG
jgi:AcrR family transcriptional regulator